MHFAKIEDNQYLIRLQKGEEILSMLKHFAKKHGIKNASFTAIGSLQDPTLAYYRIHEKKFIEKEFPGFFELISSIGTIALYNDDIVVHTHVTLSDEHFQAFAGHLMKATVSATVEMTLTFYPTTYTKIDDEETGLKLWDFPDKIT